jgi:hypothetical protein
MEQDKDQLAVTAMDLRIGSSEQVVALTVILSPTAEVV